MKSINKIIGSKKLKENDKEYSARKPSEQDAQKKRENGKILN